MTDASTIREEARDVPVAGEYDVCVIGGSCTGVFAAIAAARMGARAAVIEANGFLGGTAASAVLGVWHSVWCTERRERIIGGLTSHVVDRLRARDAVIELEPTADMQYILNTDELKVELDALAAEWGVRTFLHARFAAPLLEDNRVTATFIEDKSGRRAIKAGVFVDASGDGDLLARSGLPFETRGDLQPPTTTLWIGGVPSDPAAHRAITHAIFAPEHRGRIPYGHAWGAPVKGLDGVRFVAGTRVPGADCSDADSLTRAEIEGRRQAREIVDIVRGAVPGCEGAFLARLPAAIGIRETRHAVCLHTLTEREVLAGERFADAIANGSYRVDVHHSDGPGVTFRYLDGREDFLVPEGPVERGRWRPETETSPTFYQVPYRSLVPEGSRNVLVAGRLIGADRGAYGAIRVMVNCNQTGEAAGAAAALAAAGSLDVAEVDAAALRRELAARGAVMI